MVIIRDMRSYNVVQAKIHLSEILDRIAEGEEVLLTRRGKPVARLLPAERTANILGAGVHDPNLNREVVARDDWWKALPEQEANAWYE